MGSLTDIIAYPLGYVMEFCYNFIHNYGLAIIVFTLITKFILLPVAVWVQKNSIKMVKIQPAINRIKAKYFGDADTIAIEESKLYKQEKYNPLASLIPLVLQIVILLGVIGVIYNPFTHLFHLPQETIEAINNLAAQISGQSVDSSSIQLTAINLIKGDHFKEFEAIVSTEYLNQIKSFDLGFLGINLSYIPSQTFGITILVPIIAGLSSYLLCVCQNTSNVLQSEQSKANKWGTLVFSVGLSLYLGFFVPAGIALYWVASNLFAVIQLYILNAIISPKKYVDYEALEESRKELKAMQSLGEKKKPFGKDENAKREKEDYKRFFSIGNKHLVIYSERSGFYKYYAEIVEYLLKKTNVTIHYVTNDPDDKIFELAKEEPKIKPYYIGVKKLITLMMKIEADIVVMTTPDLDNMYLKRSLMRKDIEYIFVPHDPNSLHMTFKENSLDNYDTIFCTGPNIAKEIRASEKLYGTKEKTLVEFGYPFIEKLIDSYEKMPKREGGKKQILIAPSWQEDNLIDSCIDVLIKQLYCDDYKIIVRPHPEYMKRYKEKMLAVCERYADKVGENLEFELDFSSSESIYSSDIIITDWSGTGIEFGFATLKPGIFVNTKMKVENPNYENLGIVPQEIRLRSVLGVDINPEDLESKIAHTVKSLLNDKSFYENAKKEREEYFYNLGTAGAVGAKYIIKKLIKK